MDILFTPKIGVSHEFGDWRIDPDNPDRVIGEIIATYRLPDPRCCAVLKNADWSAPLGAEESVKS